MNVPTVLRDKVCVELNEVVEKSPGGLYIPTIVDQDVVEGKVVSVGNGHILNSGDYFPLSLAIGETVVFKKSVATQVTVGGKKFFVIHESDVLCKY